MARLKKTIYNSNLLPAFSYTVRIGNVKKDFLRKDAHEIGGWCMAVWESGANAPAMIYSNIDWDNDNILYCSYELIKDDFFTEV